jgi:hypothetical protein
MSRITLSTRGLIVTLACLAAAACQLPRPDTIPVRTIEPQITEPAASGPKASDAVPVRLLDTQRRGYIGRAVLHQEPSGEIVEDSAWRWSSAPDRYLDTALRYELSSKPELRPVDSSNARTAAVTLLSWHLESAGGPRLVGAVQLDVTGADRAIRTQVIRASEVVSAELPGDLAAAAGRLLRRLASDVVAQIAKPGQS